jgi:hypothetical protein
MLDMSTLFVPPDTAFADGDFSLPFQFGESTPMIGEGYGPSLRDQDGEEAVRSSEFSWLLPGGGISYNFPDEPQGS